MKFEMTKTIGTTQFKFTEEVKNEKEFIQKASFFASMPSVCGNCKSTDIQLTYRTPKGYEYYSVDCGSCGHSLKYGQLQDGGALFPKGWEAPFDGGTQPQQKQATKGAPVNGRGRAQQRTTPTDVGFE